MRILALTILLSASLAAGQDAKWNDLAPGFSILKHKLAVKSEVGDSTATVVRIDPNRYQLKLLSASALDHGKRDADTWAREHKLLAVTNAGMFDLDHVSHLGFMMSNGKVHQTKLRHDYLSVAVFDPRKDDEKPFRIYDTDETKFATIRPHWKSAVQNLRLIKHPGENRWTQQTKKWSEAALGQDKAGNILFIFCRSPYSMHDLNEHLLKLPIDLVAAQHLEGGPEASLFIDYKETKLSLKGSYETGFNENDDNQRFWALPNVLGVVERQK